VTAVEAGQVMAIALAGAVQRENAEEALEFLQRHLLPLPFERTRDHVHRYVASHKWVGSLAELLDAAGVQEDARHDLVRAVRDGGQMVRDLRSVSGWTYVPVGAALPQGAIEAAEVAAGPTTGPMPALPSGEPITEVQRQRNLQRLASLGRGLADRKSAS
jgi:hypothetical protein